MMKQLYYAIFLLSSLGIFAQSNPVAVDDSAQVMNQKIVAIPVLDNDYDPDGDSIIISRVYSADHGDEWHDDTLAYYQSEWFEGWERLKYKIEKADDPSFESDIAYIHIEVLENPDVPFAIADTFTIRKLEPTILHLLANDGDPNNDSLIVYNVHSQYEWIEMIGSPDGQTITVSSKYAAPDEFTFQYDNREKNTTTLYVSNETEVLLTIIDNPDLPIATNDTFQMTGGIDQYLNVLENDIIPLSDTIEIYEYTIPYHGTLTLVDNQFYVRIDTSFSGKTSFKYRFRYKNKPWLYTDKASVSISVEKNPNCPVGETDYASGEAYTFIPILVLENDNDPNGDEIEIKDVRSKYVNASTIIFSGDTVFYRPPVNINGPDTAFYRIQKVNDPNYFSEWINVVFDVSWNPGYPLCIPDSGTTKGGMPVEIDFRTNDIIQDSLEYIGAKIYQYGAKGIASRVNDSTLLYTPFSRSVGRDTIRYEYMRFDQYPFRLAEGEVYIDIMNSKSYDSLDLNNINAGFNASGFHFSRIDEILNEGIEEYTSHFEVPKGSGKHTMFSQTMWIGGLDESSMLHLGAERFRQYGIDFQPGPIYEGGYDSIYFQKWNRIWKLNKTDVEYHINNWWKEDYEAIEPIFSWPGNGDGNGMAVQLAPFHDNDANGVYDPMAGDYPLIRGDQCLFFITNDDKVHSESQGIPLQTEIHWMAYAFDDTEDSILNNTVFVHYDLINRSNFTYSDTYFGVFTDFSLGWPWDDYVGSHVSGNSYFAYSDEYDGYGETGSYGDKPPAQSVTFLAGPYIDPDDSDNPLGQCDEGMNGLNFENGIVDDERHGMSYFIYFNSSPGPNSDPYVDSEFYNYMTAKWKDNTPLLFGGYGHYFYGGVGPECRYMWPGDTDPNNWGTNCVLPNGGYNVDGKWWTETGEGINGFDTRGFASSGPFTFHPGDVQEVDMAYVFANSYYSADSSVKLLSDRLLELRQRILNGEILVPNNELNINEQPATSNNIHIYPNPAREVIYIKGADKLEGAEFRIYNMMGTCILNGKLESEINISGLQKGLYIMTFISGNGISTGKFIKN